MPPTLQNTKYHQRDFNPIRQEMNVIGKLIVDAACAVHKSLRLGLFLVSYSALVLWRQKKFLTHLLLNSQIG
ncbi:MAG: hypothetical protein PF484_06100 [Bacteroidales bacterium]|jgi:hypothetical protein|nr:hypothetical protein [Bacteroidales bacterium]